MKAPKKVRRRRAIKRIQDRRYAKIQHAKRQERQQITPMAELRAWQKNRRDAIARLLRELGISRNTWNRRGKPRADELPPRWPPRRPAPAPAPAPEEMRDELEHQ